MSLYDHGERAELSPGAAGDLSEEAISSDLRPADAIKVGAALDPEILKERAAEIAEKIAQ